jgi:hypothetical protein
MNRQSRYPRLRAFLATLWLPLCRYPAAALWLAILAVVVILAATGQLQP